MGFKSSELPLFEGEELLSHVNVPFDHARPALGLDLLAELMTARGRKMPIASRALDNSRGEGLFEAEFGRDALTMAAFVAEAMPSVTVATVFRLAELQGVADRTRGGTRSDGEEVGRIVHEFRMVDDPIAIKYTAKFGWNWPYYGTVDATPLFVSAACRAAQHNPGILHQMVLQRDGFERSIAECLARAIEWITRRVTNSPMGLLDSTVATNACWQVWEDSPDAYHHADGSLAAGRIASIEVQAFVYDALLDAADLWGDDSLIHLADRVRANVIRHGWLEDRGGYFAAAIEHNNAEITPLAVRKANMGLLLNSRILETNDSEPYVAGIVKQLTDESGMWSPNGIRTLAADEIRFRPQAYHNGSIWPWQNLWIAQGLRRHGFNDIATDIESRMVNIVDATGCAPEFIQGDDSPLPRMVEDIAVVRSSDGRGSTFEHTMMQPAQKFQGWTVFGLLGMQHARQNALATSAV